MNSETSSSSSPSSNSNSGGGRSRRSNQKRRRGGQRRPNNGGNTPNQNAPQNAAAAPNGVKKKSSSNRRRRGGKPRSGPKLVGFDLIAANYNKVLADHLEARKKYFELYFRAQPQQRDKLERLFHESLDKVYNFESSVEEQYLAQFKEMVDGLAPDLVYSQRRELPPEGELEITSEAEIEDPHYLESQKSADYADDTEESMGSLDDYKAYKGITE